LTPPTELARYDQTRDQLSTQWFSANIDGDYERVTQPPKKRPPAGGRFYIQLSPAVGDELLKINLVAKIASCYLVLMAINRRVCC